MEQKLDIVNSKVHSAYKMNNKTKLAFVSFITKMQHGQIGSFTTKKGPWVETFRKAQHPRDERTHAYLQVMVK